MIIICSAVCPRLHPRGTLLFDSNEVGIALVRKMVGLAAQKTAPCFVCGAPEYHVGAIDTGCATKEAALPQFREIHDYVWLLQVCVTENRQPAKLN